MANPLRDTSGYGTVSAKKIYSSLIQGGKDLTGDTFADLKFRAYGTDTTKFVTMTLSAQNTTNPKVTFTPGGYTGTPNTIISNVETPAAASDAANKKYIDDHAALTSTHGVTGDIVGTGGGQTLDSKTLTNAIITATSNNVAAKSLLSATTTVDVFAATAPAPGQILTATSNTAATWQNPTVTQKPISGTAITASKSMTQGEVTIHYIVNSTADITITLVNTITTNSEYDFTMKSAFNVTFASNASCTLLYPGSTAVNNNTATWSSTERYSTVTVKKISSTEWILMGPVG